MKFFKLLSMCILLMAIMACDDDKDEKKELDSSNNDIIGVYTNETSDIDKNEFDKAKTTYNKDNTFEIISEIFLDEKFAEKSTISKTTGTYTIGKTLTDGIKEIDLEFNKSFSTPGNEEEAQKWNTIKLCGFADWKKDVEKETTGTDCAKGYPLTFYNVYKIENSKLYMGKCSEGLCSSSDKRPTNVDKSEYFTKN